MAGPVVHRTLSVERTYPAPPARVFAAFADLRTKRRWFAEGPGFEVDEFTLDFRVGGFERTRFRSVGGGAPTRNDTLFLDIVAGERIVFAYSLSAEEVRTSAALTTVELAGDATAALRRLLDRCPRRGSGGSPPLDRPVRSD
jgi:uncharacterized protein YndB with AHSA1/START domain